MDRSPGAMDSEPTSDSAKSCTYILVQSADTDRSPSLSLPGRGRAISQSLDLREPWIQSHRADSAKSALISVLVRIIHDQFRPAPVFGLDTVPRRTTIPIIEARNGSRRVLFNKVSNPLNAHKPIGTDEKSNNICTTRI